MLNPFVVYYIVDLAVVILATTVLNRLMEGKLSDTIVSNYSLVTGLIVVLGNVIGILPIFPQFRQILEETKSEKISPLRLAICIFCACVMSVGLNILISRIGIEEISPIYKETKKEMYDIPFLLGLILYGVVSPFCEEVVFRALTYGRMKKYLPISLSILLSSLLFGINHGNLVQAIYASVLGVVIALFYEKYKNFAYPLAFHATANVLIYVMACMG